MDPITHGFLGAAIGQGIAQKRLGNKAIIVGAGASMAPDLDVFIRQAQDPTVFMFYHRNFTHALSFIPVGGAIIALVCLLCFKSLRKQWPWVFLVAIAAYATHGLLDTCTSYGTMLLWPFSDVRISWDIISIVDPVFTFFLIMGVVFSYLTQSSKPAIIAVVVSLSYLGFGYYQHHRAMLVQHQIANSRQQIISRGRAMPDFATLFSYHSVYIAQNTIYIDEIKTPLFRKSYAIFGIGIPLFQEKDLPMQIRQNKILMSDFAIFNWFCNGYIAKINNTPLIIGDMRYVFSTKPLTVMWGIQFPTDSKRLHVYWRRRV